MSRLVAVVAWVWTVVALAASPAMASSVDDVDTRPDGLTSVTVQPPAAAPVPEPPRVGASLRVAGALPVDRTFAIVPVTSPRPPTPFVRARREALRASIPRRVLSTDEPPPPPRSH
jgi:hypothetical protein